MKNMITQNGRRSTCVTACTLLVLGIAAAVAAAPCQKGCVQATCFVRIGSCLHFSDITCAAFDDWNADPDRGAVAAVDCIDFYEGTVEIQMGVADSCSQECANQNSRALNAFGMSTCGDVENEEDTDKFLCDYPP